MHAQPLTASFVVPSVPEGFNSRQEYLDYCNSVAASELKTTLETPSFSEFRAKIAQAESSDPTVIKTDWGGVYITLRNDPEVEKYLVVDQGRYLAFETHTQKVERLEVREGLGVIVYRPEGSSSLEACKLEPGFSILLNPGQEHCIIAVSNLLVFEQSMDYLGMDQDLTFIFEP